MPDITAASISVHMRSFTVETPASKEPAWAGEVPRWHQLDPATFAVVEAADRFRTQFPDEWTKQQPGAIWLATPGGSNLADSEFTARGSRSPSRFVGTLPSIRSSSLTLLMNWRGPVMCVLDGPATTAKGLIEAYWSLRGGDDKPAWVITTSQAKSGEGHEFIVTFFCCGVAESTGFAMTAHSESVGAASERDLQDIRKWMLQTDSSDLHLGTDVKIFRT